MNICPFCGNSRKNFLNQNGYNVSDMYFYEDEDFSISREFNKQVQIYLISS